eukprot:TRINITY_DN29205_c0_g1_i1.p1 TRINITY_DN29205_c0_g1~~TRINITY_DN29205_c0_g1_i1.p1  ORF type:complete len:481 (+),score=107.18 TRINITY_DN29205_c0_g1_i1:80-1522(+)
MASSPAAVRALVALLLSRSNGEASMVAGDGVAVPGEAAATAPLDENGDISTIEAAAEALAAAARDLDLMRSVARELIRLRVGNQHEPEKQGACVRLSDVMAIAARAHLELGLTSPPVAELFVLATRHDPSGGRRFGALALARCVSDILASLPAATAAATAGAYPPLPAAVAAASAVLAARAPLMAVDTAPAPMVVEAAADADAAVSKFAQLPPLPLTPPGSAPTTPRASGGGSCSRAAPFTPPPRSKSTPSGPPPSPMEEDSLRLTVRSLAGGNQEVFLTSDASAADLYAAVRRTPLVGPAAGDFLLSSCGALLPRGFASLAATGLKSGSFVDLVRVTPPPERLRLTSAMPGCGPSVRGACGTFRRAPGGAAKNGRPIYVRDGGLSSWNHAMAYHGAGDRFLLFEEHPRLGGRWALVDASDWAGYDDASYAYIAADVPHPAYLESRCWSVFKDAHWAHQRGWLEHACLALTVEPCEEDAR